MRKAIVALPLLLLATAGCSQFRDPAVAVAPPEQPQSEGEFLPPEPRTPPLDYSGFDPGNIIDDQTFYDDSAMSIEQIEQFLAETNAGCRPGEAPCITDYVEDTPTISGGSLCGDYIGAPGESAAEIIYYSATQCGINPQVLLVMLQKEQGLLTASSIRLTEQKYTIAMGFACPDTANCDSRFFGFTNQVFGAAKQLRRYAAEPQNFSVFAAQDNKIAYHPNPSCGGSSVFVENQATASLYNYTPYQPGGGEGCESHGNANFYAYFKAWFG